MAWGTPTDAATAALIATRFDAEHGVAAALRQVLDCAWWLLRAHVANVHLLPREEALEPPPAAWLRGLAGRADPPCRRQGSEALSERAVARASRQNTPCLSEPSPNRVTQAALFAIRGGDMEFHHAPKLWHGWREFLREYAIVVVGVLTAAVVGLTVNWLDRRAEVAEARAALRSEIAQNASNALFNIEEERCRSGFLDRVAAWANGGPRPQPKSGAGLNMLSTSTWDVVKVGAAAHMPLRERLAYSQFYGRVEANRWLIENERAVLLRLAGRVLNDARTSAAAQLIREDITQARAIGLIHSHESTLILQEAKAAGVKPQPLSAATREDLAGLCADGGIALAPSTP